MTATALGPRGSTWAVRARHLRGLSWVTWRQHRLAVAVVLAVFGGMGILFLVDGPAMHHAYAGAGLTTCGRLDSGACLGGMESFLSHYADRVHLLSQFLGYVPVPLGVFIGAPLVAREFETGTFRLAWTQGRSRVQWIVAKLVILGTVLTTLTLGFSALYTWWYGPFDAIDGRLGSYAYEVSGLVFAARTLFAFTLGVLLGAIIRRTLPAMVATLAAGLAVVLPTRQLLRPLIQAPITAQGPDGPINAWILDRWIEDPSGHRVGIGYVMRRMGLGDSHSKVTPAVVNGWLSQHHYTQWVQYQPNDRFWHFQLVESSAYLALALLLATAVVLWLRRRAV